MTGPLHRPRWQALAIGPGGVPPASVRPLGGDAPASVRQLGGDAPASVRPLGGDAPASVRQLGGDRLAGGSPAREVATAPPLVEVRAIPQPTAPGYPDPSDLPPAWQQWSAAGNAIPELPRRRPLRGPAWKIAAAVAAFCVLIGLALWGNSARPIGSSLSGQVMVGDCLSSTGRQIDGAVACGNPSADFLVVGRYPDTADAGECTASPADLAVVQSGPTLLCLNYVAVTGDCLVLGTAGPVGKVDCGSGTVGEYRVREVLKNSIDPDDCPAGTTQTLVHRYNSEVLCLTRS